MVASEGRKVAFTIIECALHPCRNVAKIESPDEGYQQEVLMATGWTRRGYDQWVCAGHFGLFVREKIV